MIDIDKAKGAFDSESALHSFDGGKPNSVGVIDVRSCFADQSVLARVFRSRERGGNKFFDLRRMVFRCFNRSLNG